MRKPAKWCWSATPGAAPSSPTSTSDKVKALVYVARLHRRKVEAGNLGKDYAAYPGASPACKSTPLLAASWTRSPRTSRKTTRLAQAALIAATGPIAAKAFAKPPPVAWKANKAATTSWPARTA
jgi:hypothetical protein